MPSTPVVIHLVFAVGALVLGPFALWARKGSRGHRAAGYAWVTLMLGAAISSLFVRNFGSPNIAGYTPIHLFTLSTFAGIGGGLWFIARGNVLHHKRFMQGTYIGGCVVAGLFALLSPDRYLGGLLWNLLASIDSSMVMAILSHTPGWVFALLLALLALGISQCFTREVSLQRVLLLPLAMVSLAVYGLVSAFGAQPITLSLWSVAALLSASLVLARPVPAGTRYDAQRRRYLVPGSAVPLLLIVGLFAAKYAVNVELALQPGLAQQASFTSAVSALYGCSSGVFMGRAARLWKLAHAASRQQPAQLAAAAGLA